MSELVFVRHGQASFGAESYDKLSTLGIRQIEILAEHWHRTGERFDHIYSGELLRQVETANGLLSLVHTDPATGMSAQALVHRGLNEYNGSPLIDIYLRDHAAQAGIGAGVQSPINDRRLFQQVFEAATAKWINDQLHPAAHDVAFEAWSEFQRRVYAAMDEIMQRHSNGSKVLISTSGGVIALALQRVMQLPDSQAIAVNWMVNNSSVTRIRYGGGRASLSLFNGLSHLEEPQYRELRTFR